MGESVSLFFVFISNMIIPFMFVVIIVVGYSKKVDLYEEFKLGAVDGMKTTVSIMPTILGLMVAVGILRASGFLDLLSSVVGVFVDGFFPVEAVPLTFMRLVSSSASTGLLLDLYENYGTDSYIGTFVSIMMSSTETVFYTMSVYFMSVKITKTRYTLAGALVSNVAGIVASLVITNVMFG